MINDEPTMTDAELSAMKHGEMVEVLTWAYAPGQPFSDRPAICRRHRGTYEYCASSDGVEVHYVDTWTGAGRVGVCFENIKRVHE